MAKDLASRLEGKGPVLLDREPMFLAQERKDMVRSLKDKLNR